ncbi:GNAT family N-acetyltransferase [Pluralibacter gergoviae]|uniref:GNAT family N-acetyltransferase n=1 Tax=Pluralibacter gergoviae TaxID=61647 RepID=A0AAI9GNT1_PLUGE|nr:GNAT family N-acetyltransferase [Pluralibacter gergoviae]EKV0917767.1 GNAT family N-acetyltransferase [Pluralibacter gergoviae]EKV9909746.1 GNAT family N-acetyltransferase [Pluralibacter gergoviae]EKW7275835.1 GNAT family N-acetyltransferase [Pluralibacter gergoviae]ELD4298237.1 GNAT family N-acetyltransferase [Pluralibacter gergoviae]ELD4308929.1 GNAT family N-acetyltransferase [Pluralibacter gergoviae]
MPADIRLVQLSADAVRDRISQLADVLEDCVAGGASVSFMLPFHRDTAIAFWQGVARSAAAGERRVLAAIDDKDTVIGTVQLIVDLPENQPHRAEVAKQLVHSRGRRRGIAAALMAELERLAAAGNKTTLVLDTATGSGAETFYSRCGWQRVGVIPAFALMPDGEMTGTTLFYKQLAPQ